MADLIDRDALIDYLDKNASRLGITVANKCNFMDIAKMQKQVDAVPVVHGMWEYEHGAWQCSICAEDNPYGIDFETDNFAKFCPNCGAKMDGKETV